MKAPYTELFTFYVSAYKTAQFSISLDGELIISNQFDQETNDQAHGSFFKSRQILLSSETMHRIRIEFASKPGQAKFKLLWESQSVPLSLIDSGSLWNELNSSLTPFIFKVAPAVTDSQTTLFTNFAAVQSATVNVEESHILIARDVYGNLKQDQFDTFDVYLTHKYEP